MAASVVSDSAFNGLFFTVFYFTISESTICNSTLTSSTTVVTAAHCMTSRSQFEVKTMLMLMLMIQVVVGAHQLQTADGGQMVNISFFVFKGIKLSLF